MQQTILYRSFLITALFIAVPLLGAQAVTTHTDWEKEGVLIHDDAYTNVEVIQVKKGKWRMYYGYNGSVLSAVSTDGTTWTTEDDTRIENGGMVSILELSDGTIRLYFTRRVDEKSVMLSAMSVDGLTFEEEDGVRLEPGHPQGYDDLSGIIHPSIVELNNGKYRAYYDTLYTEPPSEDEGGDCDDEEEDCEGDGTSDWKILSATSSDGLSFTIDEGIRIRPKKDMPTPADSVWNPHVRRVGKVYEMYFGAQYDERPLTRNAIYKATSTNGRTWQVLKKPIILRSKGLKKEYTDGGMNGAPQDPFVVKMNNRDRIYFWVTDVGILSARMSG